MFGNIRISLHSFFSISAAVLFSTKTLLCHHFSGSGTDENDDWDGLSVHLLHGWLRFLKALVSISDDLSLLNVVAIGAAPYRV